MFSASDPIYMFQLINILGDDYIVWDKSSEIKFLRPGKSTLYYDFEITDELLQTIKDETAQNGSYVFQLPVELTDTNGNVSCLVSKTMYVATKAHYKAKQKN